MRYLCILFLFCAVTTYSQTFYSPVICKLTLRVDEGVRFWGIPGTGSMVTIDADGYLSRGYAGAATVTGLVPTEVLFGKSDGTIDQDAEFTYDEADNNLIVSGAASGYYAIGSGVNGVLTPTYLTINGGTNVNTLTSDYLRFTTGATYTDIQRRSGGSNYTFIIPNVDG